MSIRPLLCLLLATAMAACGSSTADERLGAAEHSVQAGDSADARRGVDLLMNSADTASMSAGELCRAALIYSALSEDAGGGSESDAAMAARCMRLALRTDAAAVDSFVQTLPVEQRAQMTMAIQLCSGPSPDRIRDFEENDTTTLPSSEIPQP